MAVTEPQRRRVPLDQLVPGIDPLRVPGLPRRRRRLRLPRRLRHGWDACAAFVAHAIEAATDDRRRSPLADLLGPLLVATLRLTLGHRATPASMARPTAAASASGACATTGALAVAFVLAQLGGADFPTRPTRLRRHPRLRRLPPRRCPRDRRHPPGDRRPDRPPPRHRRARRRQRSSPSWRRLLGLIGFVNSFERVQSAVTPSFGGLAWTVPLGIDIGIAVFTGLDLVMARMGMRLPGCAWCPGRSSPSRSTSTSPTSTTRWRWWRTPRSRACG